MNSLSFTAIDTAAIQYNIDQFRRMLSADYRIAAVIKSNAYGHGMIPLARFLQTHKMVEYLAVANDLEALRLRQQDIHLPIIVLSYWDEKNLPALIHHDIALSIYSMRQLAAIRHNGDTCNVHLKVDTGMRRLGIAPDEVAGYLQNIKDNKNVVLQGIFSHFAIADEDEAVTKQQLSQFAEVVSKVKQHIDVPLVHIANSAGVVVADSNCNMIRLGIAMYGLEPSSAHPRFQLRPALTWQTRVIQVKNVRVGERLSYGLTYEFTQDAKIAVLAIGYGDGYDRKLSNCGEVLIRGKRFPVRGRVCMNVTVVEVDESVQEGDAVILIGGQGNEKITADELAAKAGTINYEVVTRINPEIQRVIQ